MRLFVGLGNPGPRYAGNRHNVGFMALDAIARAHGAAPPRKRFQAEVAEAMLGPERVLLLWPQTYMNDSGQSVGEAMRFFKIALDDVVVFHAELDLPPGKLRVKTGGGKPFFTALDGWVKLNLVETRTFPGGVVLTRYATRRGA